MEATLNGSVPRTDGKNLTMKALRATFGNEIGAYLEEQGREHLRFDEMIGLLKPILLHLDPEVRKMICSYREIGEA